MSQIPEHYKDVGPGWKPILERLHRDLERMDEKYSVERVYEKFGGLRVKLKNETPAILDVLTHAEWRSEKRCELCGGFGAPQMVRDEWKTRCSECMKDQL